MLEVPLDFLVLAETPFDLIIGALLTEVPDSALNMRNHTVTFSICFGNRSIRSIFSLFGESANEVGQKEVEFTSD